MSDVLGDLMSPLTLTLSSDAEISAISQKLQSKLGNVKGQVYETVKKYHEEFSETLSFATELNEKVESLVRDCNAVRIAVEEGVTGADGVHTESVRARLNNAKSSTASLTSQLKTTDTTISTLKSICEIHEGLIGYQHDVDSADYIKAAKTVRHMSALLERIAPSPQDENVGSATAATDANIFSVLRAEIRKTRSTLRSVLETLWTAALLWREVDGGSSELAVTATTTNGVTLAHIINAMNIMNILEPKLKALSLSALRHIIQPLLQSGVRTLSVNQIHHTSTLRITGAHDVNKPTAKGKKSATQPAPVPVDKSAPVDLFPKLLSVITFFQQTVFGPSATEKPCDSIYPTVFGQFGGVFWPELAQVVVQECLAAAIPESAAELADYMAIVEAAAEFEYRLQENGFLPEENSSKQVLSRYASDVHVHFANKKRQYVLAAARQLMLSEDHNTVEVNSKTERGGLNAVKLDPVMLKTMEQLTNAKDGAELSEGIFRLPACRITVCAQSIVETAYTTLTEACSATQDTPACAIQLFNTVRDLFDLFRACVPTHHRRNIDTLPQLAMLFHNDCMYIAHHLLTLGHQFRGGLPAPLSDTATFIDMVPVFRTLAEECYLAQIKYQKAQLTTLLESCHGLADTQKPERATACERMIKQLLHHLTHLHSVLSNVLPSNMFIAFMATLVDHCARHIVSDITKIGDFDVDETRQLYYLITLFADKVPALFEQPKAANVQPTPIVVREFVKSWDRLLQTSKILQLGLADIVEMWSNGQGMQLSAAEVRTFIKALFKESPLRERCLAAIK